MICVYIYTHVQVYTCRSGFSNPCILGLDAQQVDIPNETRINKRTKHPYCLPLRTIGPLPQKQTPMPEPCSFCVFLLFRRLAPHQEIWIPRPAGGSSNSHFHKCRTQELCCRVQERGSSAVLVLWAPISRKWALGVEMRKFQNTRYPDAGPTSRIPVVRPCHNMRVGFGLRVGTARRSQYFGLKLFGSGVPEDSLVQGLVS